MLLYENGRFHSGPISFALPEGFYLDSAHTGVREKP